MLHNSSRLIVDSFTKQYFFLKTWCALGFTDEDEDIKLFQGSEWELVALHPAARLRKLRDYDDSGYLAEGFVCPLKEIVSRTDVTQFNCQFKIHQVFKT